jgi:hypothetical protein
MKNIRYFLNKINIILKFLVGDGITNILVLQNAANYKVIQIMFKALKFIINTCLYFYKLLKIYKTNILMCFNILFLFFLLKLIVIQDQSIENTNILLKNIYILLIKIFPFFDNFSPNKIIIILIIILFILLNLIIYKIRIINIIISGFLLRYQYKAYKFYGDNKIIDFYGFSIKNVYLTTAEQVELSEQQLILTNPEYFWSYKTDNLTLCNKGISVITDNLTLWNRGISVIDYNFIQNSLILLGFCAAVFCIYKTLGPNSSDEGYSLNWKRPEPPEIIVSEAPQEEELSSYAYTMRRLINCNLDWIFKNKKYMHNANIMDVETFKEEFREEIVQEAIMKNIISEATPDWAQIAIYVKEACAKAYDIYKERYS